MTNKCTFSSFVVDEMSSRIEDLEKSIGELIQDADDDSKTPPASKTT